MPRQSDAKIKAQALKLYAQGHTKVEIAKRCKASYRTIQRWLADAQPVILAAKVTDTPKSETTAVNAPEIEIRHIPCPLSQLDRIATARPGEVTLVEFSQNTAIELLRLTGKSLAIVASALDDPDVRLSDRLKATQILHNAVGIGQRHGSVFRSIKTLLEPPKLQGQKLREYQDFWGKDLIPDPIFTPEQLERQKRLREERAKEKPPFEIDYGAGGESSESV